jgi:hypothetical protein
VHQQFLASSKINNEAFANMHLNQELAQIGATFTSITDGVTRMQCADAGGLFCKWGLTTDPNRR